MRDTNFGKGACPDRVEGNLFFSANDSTHGWEFGCVYLLNFRISAGQANRPPTKTPPASEDIVKIRDHRSSLAQDGGLAVRKR